MNQFIEIPKCDKEHTIYPSWCPTTNSNGDECRPNIRCQCGEYTDITNHHIHPDGRVTASYYHHFHERPNPGCGWHVYLKLLEWSGSEFPPGLHSVARNKTTQL